MSADVQGDDDGRRQRRVVTDRRAAPAALSTLSIRRPLERPARTRKATPRPASTANLFSDVQELPLRNLRSSPLWPSRGADCRRIESDRRQTAWVRRCTGGSATRSAWRIRSPTSGRRRSCTTGTGGSGYASPKWRRAAPCGHYDAPTRRYNIRNKCVCEVYAMRPEARTTTASLLSGTRSTGRSHSIGNCTSPTRSTQENNMGGDAGRTQHRKIGRHGDTSDRTQQDVAPKPATPPPRTVAAEPHRSRA